MFRKLPEACNLHIFSFLSSSDIRNTRTINNATNHLTSQPLLWKNVLKSKFFFIPEYSLEKKYNKLTKKLLIEEEKLSTYLTAVLFLLEIKKQNKNDASPDRYSDKDTKHDQKYVDKLDRLDVALLSSEKDFIEKFQSIKNKARNIDEKKIQQAVTKLIHSDITSQSYNTMEHSTKEFLFALVKWDMPLKLRIMLNQIQGNQPLLDKLLFLACLYSNFSAAKLLIEFGADVNTNHFLKEANLCVQTTCLFAILHLLDCPTKKMVGQSIILLLLNHSADPDFESYVINDKNELLSPGSLREICKKEKIDALEHGDNEKIKILDLIINAPKLTPDESLMKKMRV